MDNDHSLADKSDFFQDPETMLKPAALWRAVFDDERAGEEDLEEHEVIAGIREYQRPREVETKGKQDRSSVRASRGRDRSGSKSGEHATKTAAVREVEIDGWLVTGSKYLFKTVRRRSEEIFRLPAPGSMETQCTKLTSDGWNFGDIVGWLPADRSRFYKDPMARQQPAPLWHVQYREIVDGVQHEEDLQESEVIEGMKEYKKWKAGLLDKDEWLTKGSDYLKRRVRKPVPNLQGEMLPVNATVLGWLPPEQSNFFPDPTTQIPAALWRILFDDEVIGAEDLEEMEVVQYAQEYDKWKSTEDAKKRSLQAKGGRSPSKRRCGGLEHNARGVPTHTSSGEGGDTARHGTDGAQRKLTAAADDEDDEEKSLSKPDLVRGVEELRGKKIENGKVLYLAHWSGATSDDDTWMEAAQLGKDEWLVSEWEQNHDDDARDAQVQGASSSCLAGKEAGPQELKRGSPGRKRPRASSSEAQESSEEYGPPVTPHGSAAANASLSAGRAHQAGSRASSSPQRQPGACAAAAHEASPSSVERASAPNDEGGRGKRVRRPKRKFGGGSDSDP